MAKKDAGAGGNVILEGQDYEGHGDKTQPAGIQSPATFAPLATEAKSANVKTPDLGKKGKVE
jgi:hypothetical protein